MCRSLSSHAISVKVFVKLLYQLCFFGLPTYLEISTKKSFKKDISTDATQRLMPPKVSFPFFKGNSLSQKGAALGCKNGDSFFFEPKHESNQVFLDMFLNLFCFFGLLTYLVTSSIALTYLLST